MDQIRYARDYITKKIKSASPEDLVLFVGDFNVNSHKENSIVA